MLKTITAFNHILTSLCDIQESAWNNENAEWKPSKRALKTYKSVFQQLPYSIRPIKSKDIERFFCSSQKCVNLNFFEEKKVLYLPPMKRDAEDAKFVPIFSLSCNLSRNQNVARFRVMLVSLEENILKGIGFRMEPPENINQNGRHNFHHAQFIQQFSPKQYGNILPTKCPNWLPESQPAFPMPADCPVTLLLCILLTLYGWDFYNKFCDKLSTTDEYRKKLDLAMSKKQR